MKKKKLLLWAWFLVVLASEGCATVRGMGEDIQSIGRAVKEDRLWRIGRDLIRRFGNYPGKSTDAPSDEGRSIIRAVVLAFHQYQKNSPDSFHSRKVPAEELH